MSIYLVTGGCLFMISFLSSALGLYLYSSGKVYMVTYTSGSMLSVDVDYEFLFDWISCLYMGVVMFISGMVLVYSEDYMGMDVNKMRFVMLMLMFVLSMLLSVVSGGLVSVMLGWDGLGLVSYCLVIYYNSSSSYKAGMITVLSNRVGDAALLVGICWSMMYGSWNYWIYEYEGGSFFLSLSVLLAACTKSAQVPFSAWLPEASAAPTPVSSLVHSSTLVTAGIFLLIRFNYLLLEVGDLLMVLSLVTMILAGFGAMLESDMKKLVASSTLSQLGLMMFTLSVGFWELAYFHMIMHAFFKALMFLSVGSIIYSMSGSQEFRFIGSKYKVSFMVNQGLWISVLCLGGFPFLCGFFSKDIIFELYLSGEKGLFELFLFVVGFSMSILYGMRLYLWGMINMNLSGSLEGYQEYKYMNVGVGGSTFMSMISGSLYFWSMNWGEVVMLGDFMKLSGLLIMLSGMALILVLTFVNLGVEGYYSVKGYFGSMLYFSEMSGNMWKSLLSLMGKISEEDQSWFEEYGGGGMESMLENIFYYNKVEKVGSLLFILMFVSLSIYLMFW